jgi:hypothetical protein
MFPIPLGLREARPLNTVWDRLLTLGFAAAIAGGLLFVLAPEFSGLGWLNRSVTAAFFGTEEPPGAAALRRWLYAVEGSTLVAFGILGLSVVVTAFRRRERWARNALVLAIAVWYPLDTAASLARGVVANAALNTAIALVLLVPVAMTWKRFAPGRTPRAHWWSAPDGMANTAGRRGDVARAAPEAASRPVDLGTVQR